MSIADKITPRQRELIMWFSLIGTTMVSIDVTIANVALPEIQGGLAIAPDQLGWLLTSYLMSSAISTPLAGALAPRLGLRTLYLVAIAGFGLASLACGLASSVSQLVLFRAIQGFAGGVLAPLGQMLIYDICPRERIGRAVALYSMGTMSGVLVGPTIGGFITDVSSWRWIFIVNLPLAAIAVAGLISVMPRITHPETRRFDYFGFVLIAIGLLSFQLFLDRGESNGWFESREIVIEFAVAIVAFYMFVVHCLTASNPFVDLAIFKDRNFVSATTLNFAFAVVAMMPIVLTPLFLQHVQGYDVFGTGLVMTPRGFAMVGTMLLLSRIADRVDPRLLIFISAIILAISYAGMSTMTPDWPVMMMVWWGMLAAAAGSMNMLPLNLVAFSTLSPQLRPMGASMFNLFRGMGMGIGTALLMSYIAHSTEDNHVRMLQGLSVYNPAMSGPGMPDALPVTEPLSLKLLSLEVWRQATVIAYDNVFVLGCIALILGLPLLLMVRMPKRRPVAIQEEGVEALEPLPA